MDGEAGEAGEMGDGSAAEEGEGNTQWLVMRVLTSPVLALRAQALLYNQASAVWGFQLVP